MHIVGLLFSLFTRDIIGYVIHRARAIQRHQRDNIFELIGLHFAQHIAHARAFQLEHADCVAASQKLVGLCIVERQIIDIHRDARAGQQFDRFFENGECF